MDDCCCNFAVDFDVVGCLTHNCGCSGSPNSYYDLGCGCCYGHVNEHHCCRAGPRTHCPQQEVRTCQVGSLQFSQPHKLSESGPDFPDPVIDGDDARRTRVLTGGHQKVTSPRMYVIMVTKDS